MTHIEKQLVPRLDHLLDTANHLIERIGKGAKFIARHHRYSHVEISRAQPFYAIVQQAHRPQKTPLKDVRSAHHTGNEKQKQPEHLGMEAAHMCAVVPDKKIRAAIRGVLKMELMAQPRKDSSVAHIGDGRNTSVC